MKAENSLTMLQNEREADKVSAKIMLYSAIFIIFGYLLNVIGIFKVPVNVMNLICIVLLILFFIPFIVVNVLRKEGSWIKYLMVTIASVVTFIGVTAMSRHFTVVYLYALALSALYFSANLSCYALILNLLLLNLGEYLNFVLPFTIEDHNFVELRQVIKYAMIPRSIQFILISLIFIGIAKRTSALLGNVLGAEEQGNIIQAMKIMSDESKVVSSELTNSMGQFKQLYHSVHSSGKNISEKVETLAQGSKDTIDHIQKTYEDSSNISDILSHIESYSNQVEEEANVMSGVSLNSQKDMQKTMQHMEDIRESTEETKQLIQNLSKSSEEIRNIIDIIKNISSQTGLLALNAAIESAKAGESGRGFAVVADEIRKLSVRTENATDDIEALIKEVLINMENAVKGIDRSYEAVEKGQESIESTQASFNELTRISDNIKDKIGTVYHQVREVSEKSKDVAGAIENIEHINNRQLSDVDDVSGSVQEQLDSMSILLSEVEHIGAYITKLEDVNQQIKL